MKKIQSFFVLLVCIASTATHAQNITDLKNRINEILEGKEATVGISIAGMNPQDTLSINGEKKLPMQSVYKFHLALTVLNQVAQGKLSLEDTYEITPKHLDNSLWSVIRKKYPNGGYLSLADIVTYTVANSDNVGCDLLFDVIGGTKVANTYMHQMGISNVAIKDKEEMIQSNWELQYKNWTTVNTANKVLKTFFENENQELSTESHSFIWEIMKTSWFGKISMKTYLPKNTVIAHKTGHSGKNDNGLTGAQNDIGIIFLPNGNYFYLSVFINDSKETKIVNEKIIADIAKLSWNYFKSK